MITSTTHADIVRAAASLFDGGDDPRVTNPEYLRGVVEATTRALGLSDAYKADVQEEVLADVLDVSW